MLQTRLIPPANNAHAYPLLIKRLLLSGSRYEKTREIVYRDKLRYSYATFNERVARLANVLSEAGVKTGDTVAVMDWDSHRYLECMPKTVSCWSTVSSCRCTTALPRSSPPSRRPCC